MGNAPFGRMERFPCQSMEKTDKAVSQAYLRTVLSGIVAIFLSMLYTIVKEKICIIMLHMTDKEGCYLESEFIYIFWLHCCRCGGLSYFAEGMEKGLFAPFEHWVLFPLRHKFSLAAAGYDPCELWHRAVDAKCCE